MSSAGVKETINALEMLQQKTDKSLDFLNTGITEDLIQHIQGLRYVAKGPVNIIFRSNAKIRNYPCITKIFETVPGQAIGSFPKENQRDPVTCAKILYVLYNNHKNKASIPNIREKALHCKAQCDLCYKLAFEEYYKQGTLQCKK